MPNWCSNTFTVTGAQESIDRLRGLIIRENSENNPDKGGDLYLDFEGLVPMPEAMKRIDRKALNVMMTLMAAARPDQTLEACLQPGSDEANRIVTEHPEWAQLPVEQVVEKLNTDSELAARYGYRREVYEPARTCWLEHNELGSYSWCCRHWGTAYRPMWSNVSFRPEEMTVSFESGWCPPDAFYRALATQFPELKLEAIYLEECCGVAGRFNSQDGICVEESISDEGDNIRRFAIEVFGYEYDDEDE